MTKTLLITLVAVISLFVTRFVVAQEAHLEGSDPGKAAAHDRTRDATDGASDGATREATAGQAHGGDDHHDAGPVPPTDRKAVWPGLVLIGIATLFVLAAVIGPIARMHAPPTEIPPTHSHDEPPGASHHHGSSGTINPEPGHGHH